jgi:hypothetical protein
VTIETDRIHKTRVLQCGSGFLSQHSKEMVIGLGASGRLEKLTVSWPSGATQVFTDVPLNTRVRIVEGRGIETEPLKPRSAATTPPPASAPHQRRRRPGCTSRFRRRRGGAAIVLLWSPKVDAARAARDTLERGAQALTRAGVKSIAIRRSGSAGSGEPQLRDSQPAPVHEPPGLRLPTGLLVDASGSVVKVYRGRRRRRRNRCGCEAIDVTPAERLARALPFPGTFTSGCPSATTFRTAASSSTTGSSQRGRRLRAGRRGEPRRVHVVPARARCSPEAARPPRPVPRSSRRSVLKPDLAEAHNDLGALLAQSGDLDAAIGRFRAALAPTPTTRRLEQSRLRAAAHRGAIRKRRALYERALALQPISRKRSTILACSPGRTGDLAEAERRFP